MTDFEQGKVNPFEPPSADESITRQAAERVVSSLAVKSVVLGGLGILCCGLIFGPLAIGYSNRAEAAAISSDQGREHAFTWKLGRVLGYVAIALWIAGVLFRIAGFALK